MPHVISMGICTLKFKDMHEKLKFSLESMLCHLKTFEAHTREHIQDKDHNNIKPYRNKRNIIIKSYLHFIITRLFKHNN